MQSVCSPIAVLVVEDEAFVRMVVVDFLADRGLRVLEADNAHRAIQILEKNENVKVVFTDINMPGKLNGIALGRLVRERWPHIHVVMTTGAPQGEEIPEGAQFIAKPFDHDSLADQIMRLATAKTERS